SMSTTRWRPTIVLGVAATWVALPFDARAQTHVHIADKQVAIQAEPFSRPPGPVCEAPCDGWLPPGQYRVVGKGIKPSAPFTVGGSAGQHLDLRVSAAWTVTEPAGISI